MFDLLHIRHSCDCRHSAIGPVSIILCCGGRMSSAVLERVITKPAAPALVVPRHSPGDVPKVVADEHPLLPVFVAGAVAFVLATAFVGSIVLWIALRHSGVLAQ